MTTQLTLTDAAETTLAAARRGAEPVVDMLTTPGVVPRFTYDTGAYIPQPEYLPDTWRDFQWTGFLTGRLWLLATISTTPRSARLPPISHGSWVRGCRSDRRSSPRPEVTCSMRCASEPG